ncbi:hypothetical protein CK203_013861 [Vitis vinifera]|uniref:Uncharacterized protein n=1 Tax=Vitis vinifera TaxID=29760 RepID=A0A438JJ22_VITVI|nr:hypothetical protein CK203_013861 [Vitis vinifera]
MSSSLLLMEPMGGSFGSFSQLVSSVGANERSASRGDQGVTMRAFLTGSSRHGVSWLMRPYVVCSWDSSCDPGYIDSGSGLEFATGLSNADDEEALMLRPGMRNTAFSSLNLLSPGGELSVVFACQLSFFDGLTPFKIIFLSSTRGLASGRLAIFVVTESNEKCIPTDGANVVSYSSLLMILVVAKWMDTRSQPQRFLIQSLYLQKESGQGVWTHPPMVLLAMGTVPLINGEEIFYVVMMTLGGSRVIHHPMERLSETMVGDKTWAMAGLL